MPRTRHSPGYYLALTFGTLLSSQGADAHELNPSGHPSWLVVQLCAGFQNPPAGRPGPAALPGRAAQRESYVRREPVSNRLQVTPDTRPSARPDRTVGPPQEPG